MWPYPLSKGSAVNCAYVLDSVSSFLVKRFGSSKRSSLNTALSSSSSMEVSVFSVLLDVSSDILVVGLPGYPLASGNQRFAQDEQLADLQRTYGDF